MTVSFYASVFLIEIVLSPLIGDKIIFEPRFLSGWVVTVSCYPLSIYRQMVAFGIYPEIVSKLKGFNATLGHLYYLDNLPCIATKGKREAP